MGIDLDTDECECGEEGCEACIRAYKRWCEDLETQRERNYQQQLWGPDGILFDADDPLSKSCVKKGDPK